MNVRHRKAIAVFALSLLFLSLTLLGVRTGLSSDQKASLDVFTQKTPYSGRGLNVRSDAFGPQELVILYSLVTYDTIPVHDLPVHFHVNLPDNASFSLTAQTNSTGFASVNFTIMTPPTDTSANGVFGDWQVQANALANSVVVSDTLVFKVDWIVKLISLETRDGDVSSNSFFGIGGEVGFELRLRNIAMVAKSATITLTLRDELNTPVANSSSVLDVQPNDTAEFIYLKLQIPKFASVGNATCEANALTAANGIPYCPHVTVGFFITTGEQFTIRLHDASLIGISSSAWLVQAGGPLTLSVEARNEGTESEGFNVTAYFGDVAVGNAQISSLAPYSTVLLNYPVDTSASGLGTYTINASISNLLDEADLSDNNISDGAVGIGPEATVYVHDVGITEVTTSSLRVNVGESVNIDVAVTNKGNATESFNVSAYYDLVLIATLDVADLQPLNNQTLNFKWDTTSVNKTTYQISVVALLANDIDPSDNTFLDGYVTLVEALSSNFGLDWFDGFLIVGIVLLTALFAAFLLFRRYKKNDESHPS